MDLCKGFQEEKGANSLIFSHRGSSHSAAKVGCLAGQRKKLSQTQPQAYFFPSLLFASFVFVYIMSQQEYTTAQHEQHESTPTPSRWKAAWTNNKGIFMIILAQGVGSTMDAIVRFLQQGGHGMHPFQVNS